MSDFLHWLYEHYIKPQLEDIKQEEYAFYKDTFLGEVRPSYREDLDKVLEYQAVHAFLLGMRTGEGLAKAR